MKRIILLITFTIFSLFLYATDVKIEILDGEKWWGLATDLGIKAPYNESLGIVDLRTRNYNNQTSPILLSNKGRFIWCDGPFVFEIKGNTMIISPDRGEVICAQSSGSTLKDAYLAASNKFFPPTGIVPPDIFFTRPQYNTWIELMYNQNQSDIEKYAQAIVDNDFPVGVLMIDDNWQEDYGVWKFRADRFPDPKTMMNNLKNKGFKIMVWVCPFVSPDSQKYRELRKKGYLIKEKEGNRPAILDWWNGLSACYDLSNPSAFEYFKTELKDFAAEYGIDGYKFDAGDPERYLSEKVQVFDDKSYDCDQTELWAKLGLEFPFNEFRACWKMGGQQLVQRLGDKNYSWRDVTKLVPSMISAGLLGLAYTCPDMIGGGSFGSFLGIEEDKFDQSLIVRSCQIHAMMPMMQFSVAPWRILSKENIEICRKYALLHQSLGDYIIQQAKLSSQTGEPIVRHMEYSFPGEGFESCNDQYMLGTDYLVAPIIGPDNHRIVKLPKGKWMDDQGNKYKGGREYEFDVPLDRILYFTKM